MSARAPGRGRLRRRVDADGRSVYVADYSDAQGKRRRQHLAGDRPTAERVLARIIRDRDLERQGMGGEKGLDLEISFLVAQYLAELATRCKARAVEETRKILVRIVAGLPAILVRDVTRSRVSSWRTARVRAGSSNKTANNAVAALAAVLNFAVAQDRLAVSPLAGLKSLPITAMHQRRRPRALSETELQSLLSVAMGYDAANGDQIPYEPLLRFLVGTGARWSETILSTWADVDLELGTVTLRAENTKTQTTRTLPLHVDVLAALAWLREREAAYLRRSLLPADRVFLTPRGKNWTHDGHNERRHLSSMLALAGIQRRDESGRVVHIHALRHTFATRCARAGVPVATTARLTGHKTVQVLLQVYTHMATEDAREAIRSLPPLDPSRTQTPSSAIESA